MGNKRAEMIMFYEGIMNAGFKGGPLALPFTFVHFWRLYLLIMGSYMELFFILHVHSTY